MVAFIQEACCLDDISYSLLEERSDVCFRWRPVWLFTFPTVGGYIIVLRERCTQMRARPWIRCLLTKTFVEPSELCSSVFSRAAKLLLSFAGFAPATLSNFWSQPGSRTRSSKMWQLSAPGRGFPLWFIGWLNHTCCHTTVVS